MTPATLTGADVLGLIASALVCLYLLYALLRGEKL
jgi:F subunit of K+-transporting ATPase (Potass_KdpF)